MEKQIVMIGTALEARSGIAAVVQVYADQGLFKRWRARFLATHTDGSRLRKATLAGKAWLSFVLQLAMRRVALLHVLAASDASFWRKLLFVLPAWLAGVPYVLHMHCGRFVDFYRRSASPVRRLIRFELRTASAVVALSDEWHEAIAAIEPAARLRTIANPVAVPPWRAPLEGSPPTVLFLGMLKQAKGVYDLLEAWPQVLEAVPEARLVLGGTGEVAAVRARAKSLGIARSVHLPGWVLGPEKDALVREAWIFALPSHAEALPMSILECMAAGLPVVATRVGGIPLAVEPGRTGELIEAGDVAALAQALIALLTNRARRLAFGAAARRRALEEFSAEALLPRVEALWRGIAPQQEVAGRAAAVSAAKLKRPGPDMAC